MKIFVVVYQPDVALHCASHVGVPQYLQVNQLKAKLIPVAKKEKMMVQSNMDHLGSRPQPPGHQE